MPCTIHLTNIVQDQAEVTEQEYKFLNMVAMYILARVSSSQCMGLVRCGFKIGQKVSGLAGLARCRPPIVCQGHRRRRRKKEQSQKEKGSRESEGHLTMAVQQPPPPGSGPVQGTEPCTDQDLQLPSGAAHEHPCNPILCFVAFQRNSAAGRSAKFQLKVYTRHIPCINLKKMEWFIPGIYLLYDIYIMMTNVIYLVIPGI
jgi:hypothetical protein